MAARTAQHDSSGALLARDPSNANLTLHTGAVAAQSAVNSTADFDDYHLSLLEMPPNTTPRSFPSASISSGNRHSFSAAFSGDQALSGGLLFSLQGQQSYTIDPRPLEFATESSGTGIRLPYEPWNPLAATGVPNKSSKPNILAANTRSSVNAVRNLDACSENSGHPSFQDSGLGSSHYETQSVLSTSQRGMSYQGRQGIVTSRDEGYPGAPGFGERLSYQGDISHTENINDPDEAQAIVKNPELCCDVCNVQTKTPSDLKKHKARHELKFACKVPGCDRKIRGFATVNDLERHEKSKHGKNSRGSNSFKCFAEGCPKADKIWPRLDNFKQHLTRMHKDENVEDLVRRSTIFFQNDEPSETSPSRSAGLFQAMHPPPQSEGSQIRRISFPAKISKPGQIPFRSSAVLSKVPRLQNATRIPQFQGRTHLSPQSAQHIVARSSPQNFRRSNHPTPSQKSENACRYSPYPKQHLSAQLSRTQSEMPHQSSTKQAPPQPQAQAQSAIVASQLSQWTLPTELSVLDDLNTVDAMGESSQYQQDLFQEAFQSIEKAWTTPDVNPDFLLQRAEILSQEPYATDFYAMDFASQQDLMFTHGPQSIDMSIDSSANPLTSSTKIPGNSFQEPENEESKRLLQEVIEKVNALLKGYETRKDEGRLTADEVIHAFEESLRSKTSRTSASESGLGNTDVDGTSATSLMSTASSKRHRCTHKDCKAATMRKSELKKHEKRHTRPYRCAFNFTCHKSFGSKNDWKRHEETQHHQKDCYRCDGKHNEDGKSCFHVFFNGEDKYKEHLRDCDVSETQIHSILKARFIPDGNDGRFWCGFCNDIIIHSQNGSDASKQRLNHIDDHFKQAKKIDDWVELRGEGKTRLEMENEQNSVTERHGSSLSSNTQATGLDPEEAQTSPPLSSSSSSSNASPENHDDGVEVDTNLTTVTNFPPEAQSRQRALSNSSQQQQYRRQQQQFIQNYRAAQQQQQQQILSQEFHSIQQPFRDPSPAAPTRPARQKKRAQEALCCRCDHSWLFAHGSRCTVCNHDFCGDCRGSRTRIKKRKSER